MHAISISNSNEKLKKFENGNFDTSSLVHSLKNDNVVLIKNITPEHPDKIIYEISSYFGLSKNLEAQSAYASIHRHRHNIRCFSR